MERHNALPVVDVTAFGAVGDGLHDDTGAIRAAIDAVPNATPVTPSGRQVAGSRIVYFPSVVRRGGTAPGTFDAVAVYSITETVDVSGRKNIRFVSDGPFGAHLRFDGSGDPYIFRSGSGKRAHLFEHLVFDGGGVQLDGGARGITDFLTCSFAGTADFAIKTLGRSVIGGRVVNCEFAETAGGIGILHSACDLWVIGPNSRFVRMDGVGAACHSSGVTVIDCNFENKALGAERQPHVRIAPDEPFGGGLSKLVRCRFGGEVGRDASGPPETYVVLGPPEPVRGTMAGIVVEGCEFQRRNGGPTPTSGVHAIRLTKAVRETRIIGNHFQQFAGALIDEAFDPGTTNIRDNYFALNSIDSNRHSAEIFSSGAQPAGWTIVHSPPAGRIATSPDGAG
jgi:hypothetical protein